MLYITGCFCYFANAFTLKLQTNPVNLHSLRRHKLSHLTNSAERLRIKMLLLITIRMIVRFTFSI